MVMSLSRLIGDGCCGGQEVGDRGKHKRGAEEGQVAGAAREGGGCWASVIGTLLLSASFGQSLGLQPSSTGLRLLDDIGHWGTGVD